MSEAELENSEPTAVGPGFDVQFPWPWPLYTTAWTPVTNGTTASCVDDNSVSRRLEISVLVSAAIIIVLLNVLLPRCQGSLRSLQSLLDLVVPVKFLDSTPFRLIYCIVMSSWAGDVFLNVMDSRQFYRAEGSVLDALGFFVISPSVIILKQTLTYFPILACVDSSVPVIGHTIGFLYTLLMGSHNVYIEYTTLTGCSPKGQLTTRDMIMSVAVSAPVYINYLITAGWFFFHALLEAPLVLCTRQKCSQNMPVYSRNKQFYTHVRELFNSRNYSRCKSPKVINVDTLWNYLIRGLAFVLPFHPGFSYPLPFLSALSMAVMILYQLCLSWSYAAVSYTEQLMVYVREFNITVETVERFFPKLKPEVDKLFYDAKSLILAYNILLPMCFSLSLVATLGFMVYMTQHYHKLFKKASQGDRSFLVTSEPLPSMPYRLAAMMRYSAFQVSYIVLNWILNCLIGVVILSIGLLFYFLFKNFQCFGVHLWAWFMIPMAWGALMHQVQLFLCHFVFLENKHLSKNGRFVPIRFKSLYQVLSFVFFFFNVIYGFAMCFFRIFGVVVFTMTMLFRMDWDVYMRGLEGWDVGCRTFVGYMYIECTNNNAVVRTFIALLQESTDRSQTSSASLVERHEQMNRYYNINDPSDSESDEDTSNSDLTPLMPNSTITTKRVYHRRKNGAVCQTRILRSKQALNRWFLAYTLIRNPSLCAFTSTGLNLAKSNSTNQL